MVTKILKISWKGTRKSYFKNDARTLASGKELSVSIYLLYNTGSRADQTNQGILGYVKVLPGL
jgi:hypothetical protein